MKIITTYVRRLQYPYECDAADCSLAVLSCILIHCLGKGANGRLLLIVVGILQKKWTIFAAKYVKGAGELIVG